MYVIIYVCILCENFIRIVYIYMCVCVYACMYACMYEYVCMYACQSVRLCAVYMEMLCIYYLQMKVHLSVAVSNLHADTLTS